MNKKLILFLLLMLTAVITVGCNTNETNEFNDQQAFDLLEGANLATRQAEGLSISFETKTTMPFANEDSEELMENQTRGTMEVLTVDETNFVANLTLSQMLTGLEEEITYTAYFKEQALYIDLLETMELGMRSSLQPTSPFSLLNVNLDFSEERMLDQSVETTNAGIQLVFSLDATAAVATLNDQFNAIFFELENLRESTYELIVVVDDNDVIQSVELALELTYNLMGTDTEIKMNVSLSVSQEASGTLEFPDHLEDFYDFGTMRLPIF